MEKKAKVHRNNKKGQDQSRMLKTRGERRGVEERKSGDRERKHNREQGRVGRGARQKKEKDQVEKKSHCTMKVILTIKLPQKPQTLPGTQVQPEVKKKRNERKTPPPNEKKIAQPWTT
jgi:hypothetical protein